MCAFSEWWQLAYSHTQIRKVCVTDWFWQLAHSNMALRWCLNVLDNPHCQITLWMPLSMTWRTLPCYPAIILPVPMPPSMSSWVYASWYRPTRCPGCDKGWGFNRQEGWVRSDLASTYVLCPSAIAGLIFQRESVMNLTPMTNMEHFIFGLNLYLTQTHVLLVLFLFLYTCCDSY